jgi:hypothetical protein
VCSFEFRVIVSAMLPGSSRSMENVPMGAFDLREPWRRLRLDHQPTIVQGPVELGIRQNHGPRSGWLGRLNSFQLIFSNCDRLPIAKSLAGQLDKIVPFPRIKDFDMDHASNPLKGSKPRRGGFHEPRRYE